MPNAAGRRVPQVTGGLWHHAKVNANGPERIAIVSGYFNPLHVGHLRMMVAARELGDRLLVLVNNDDQQLLKKRKIIQPVEHRLEIVRALRIVDQALPTVDTDPTVIQTLGLVRAEHPLARLIFANGGDDRSRPEDVAEFATCQQLNIEFVFGVGGEDKADASSRINQLLDEQVQPHPDR